MRRLERSRSTVAAMVRGKLLSAHAHLRIEFDAHLVRTVHRRVQRIEAVTPAAICGLPAGAHDAGQAEGPPHIRAHPGGIERGEGPSDTPQRDPEIASGQRLEFVPHLPTGRVRPHMMLTPIVVGDQAAGIPPLPIPFRARLLRSGEGHQADIRDVGDGLGHTAGRGSVEEDLLPLQLGALPVRLTDIRMTGQHFRRHQVLPRPETLRRGPGKRGIGVELEQETAVRMDQMAIGADEDMVPALRPYFQTKGRRLRIGTAEQHPAGSCRNRVIRQGPFTLSELRGDRAPRFAPAHIEQVDGFVVSVHITLPM